MAVTTELLRELLSTLARDLAVDDVVAEIGSVLHDPGVPMPIVLRTARAGIRAASLSRYPDSGAPYTLALEFTPEARPTLADLALAFGEYHRVQRDRGLPVTVLFQQPSEAPSSWRVTLVAEVLAPAGDLQAGTVTSIILRRDPA
jgi:hypothetical protein